MTSLRHTYTYLIRIMLCTVLSTLVHSTSFAQADHIEDYVPLHYFPEVYHGIDVSNHQGHINWKDVAKDDNVQFVYIKATEGATYVSPTFEDNISEAKEAGMKVGCYHFLRSSSYIHDQFENFKECCRKGEQDLAPLIDIEVKGRWSRDELIDSLQLFANLLEEHYGRQPIIYTSANFYNKYLWPFFNHYDLFIAKYAEEEPELKEGAEYTLWQFTDCGAVSGIYTDVDQSRFNKGKYLNDILFHKVPRDPSIIAEIDMVRPVISMKMQTPSKFKTSRIQKIEEEKNRQEKKRKLKEKQFAAKKKDFKKKSKKKKRNKRSDIEDEDDYIPKPAHISAKSTRSKG